MVVRAWGGGEWSVVRGRRERLSLRRVIEWEPVWWQRVLSFSQCRNRTDSQLTPSSGESRLSLSTRATREATRLLSCEINHYPSGAQKHSDR